MFNLENIFHKNIVKKDEVAKILKTTPLALDAFEQSYGKLLSDAEPSDNLFEVNAKQAAQMNKENLRIDNKKVQEMVNRIVKELINDTSIWKYDGTTVTYIQKPNKSIENPVTNEEISELPEILRPQLTGTLAKVDIEKPSYLILIDMYCRYLKEKNPRKQKQFYNYFRQGLDILDLDGITYNIIGTNPDSMGYWLPQIVDATMDNDFFKIPKTAIIKVPLPLLQLTRIDYPLLTNTTLSILDKFCQKVFCLDENKEYFIKTGTYSSKFDFRNAYVHGAKEVRELGEYLLYIHYQACQMAAPLNKKSIYGVSTTNEWVVREFIPDKENNPCIYKGLPLHTEYRVFVDFDTKEVLGINPYWDPKVMKQRFGHEEDSDSPHNTHDYIIYSMHEETLMRRYRENKDMVVKQVKRLIDSTEGLLGQWSIDIMQNDDDFWIIDMALAEHSALCDCVPKEKLRPTQENWIPELIDEI